MNHDVLQWFRRVGSHAVLGEAVYPACNHLGRPTTLAATNLFTEQSTGTLYTLPLYTGPSTTIRRVLFRAQGVVNSYPVHAGLYSVQSNGWPGTLLGGGSGWIQGTSGSATFFLQTISIAPVTTDSGQSYFVGICANSAMQLHRLTADYALPTFGWAVESFQKTGVIYEVPMLFGGYVFSASAIAGLPTPLNAGSGSLLAGSGAPLVFVVME